MITGIAVMWLSMMTPTSVVLKMHGHLEYFTSACLERYDVDITGSGEDQISEPCTFFAQIKGERSQEWLLRDMTLTCSSDSSSLPEDMLQYVVRHAFGQYGMTRLQHYDRDEPDAMLPGYLTISAEGQDVYAFEMHTPDEVIPYCSPYWQQGHKVD